MLHVGFKRRCQVNCVTSKNLVSWELQRTEEICQEHCYLVAFTDSWEELTATCQTKWHGVREDDNIHKHRRENIKSLEQNIVTEIYLGIDRCDSQSGSR